MVRLGKNGEIAGTAGLAKRMEAIQIKLVEKGGKAPGTSENIMCLIREYFISHMYRPMAGRLGNKMEKQAEPADRQNVWKQ